MEQEIKLDEETKDKINMHLEQYKETISTCVDRLYAVIEKLGTMEENTEIKEFNSTFFNTYSKKYEVLSQFVELKEVMNQDMEMIIETDEEIGQTLFKIGEVVTGGSNE